MTRSRREMTGWDAETVARRAGADLAAPPSGAAAVGGPRAASVDSRSVGPGELFVGLPGEHLDGGGYAAQALRAGAWGALVAPEHARAALQAGADGAVLVREDPLAGLQELARSWRRELGARGAHVVAITGSTGKTSTKDILAALLGSHLRTAASPQNLNTEIGLPLAILAAPGDSEALVLELAMRGAGQIAQLTAIAEPDVGVIVNVGPAHLEQLGSLEAIAAAKAELIAGLRLGASVVVPAGEPLLEPHLRADVHTLTFGEGGDVRLSERHADGRLRIRHGAATIELRPSFTQAHNVSNLLAAVAAAGVLGITPSGALEVRFSAMRGQRRVLAGGVLLIEDCYNANPMSMRAAIDELSETAGGRTVAVLGDMLELGAASPHMHRDIGEHARARGVDVLLTVGPLAGEMSGAFAGGAHSVADAHAAAELLPGLLREGDTVLVKGSRGVGLERVVGALTSGEGQARESAEGPARESGADEHALAPGAGPGRR
jgi:UDP-N-acetylmuramoyl-tripeptide--D-alanyl-D-alanine ligase